ncbi:hypothetical protein ANCCAN_26471 [Ancylostoma caninum]|uniref:Uncharacterized protein n=1 Tax=Ancylostoma caninum TaxID=29170 RepID=A0A368F6M6_ANCCA|nr:hypothetical protein ANCCAN_26471 [Ancylostoma caninum]
MIFSHRFGSERTFTQKVCFLGNWIIPPQPCADGDSKPPSDKRSEYASMTYEELQAQLFADVDPPPEKRKKWHEEEQ